MPNLGREVDCTAGSGSALSSRDSAECGQAGIAAFHQIRFSPGEEDRGPCYHSARKGWPTLHRDLSLTLQLQQLDLRILQLTREIDGLPKSIALVEGRLESHKQALAAQEGRLAENGKDQRRLERKVSDLKLKVSKLQDQMNTARTNEQFRAFQHEIEYCKDAIDAEEEGILGKMEDAETLQEDVAAARESLARESKKVASDVQAARERIEADKLERSRGVERRAELAARLDPSVLRVYERIRETRGMAVAQVVAENCDSCHVRLRPKLLQDLRRLARGVMLCESCGLIVYFPESAAGLESSP